MYVDISDALPPVPTYDDLVTALRHAPLSHVVVTAEQCESLENDSRCFITPDGFISPIVTVIRMEEAE